MRRWVAAVLLPLPAVAQTPPGAAPSLVAPSVVAPSWVARQEAELSGLDKVRATAAPLSARVGQSTSFGSLTIAVKSCMVRPPDQAQDATAFVEITDSRPGAPGFRGWLLVSAPSLSMLEHPIYDIRLVACR